MGRTSDPREDPACGMIGRRGDAAYESNNTGDHRSDKSEKTMSHNFILSLRPLLAAVCRLRLLERDTQAF